jgi:hypothetical protein
MRGNTCLTAVLAELNAAGVSYAVTRGKHWHVTAAELGQRAIVVAVSASDHRAALNARAFVRRMLRQSGLEIRKPPGDETGRLIQEPRRTANSAAATARALGALT